MSNIEGTKCIIVILFSLIASTIVSGSFSPPGIRKQTLAPLNPHQNNSHTETSKVNGVF